MAEPITPKAERRVIEGEVVSEKKKPKSPRRKVDKQGQAKAKAMHQSAQKEAEKEQTLNASAKNAKTNDKSPAKRLDFVQWGLILLASAFLIVVMVLLSALKDQDWQVEQINKLQTQVQALKADNQKISDEQLALQERLKESQQALSNYSSDASNQPVISQADVQNLQDRTQQFQDEMTGVVQGYAQQFEQFKHNLSQALSKQLSQQLNQRLEQQDKQSVDGSMLEGLQAQLESATKQFESKFSTISGQVGELVEFKEESSQKQPKPLDAMTIQQWILEINGQWLLTGNRHKAHQQLLALDQAVGLSQLPQKMTLIRFIGEDLNRLKSLPAENETLDSFVADLEVWLHKQNPKTSQQVSRETLADQQTETHAEDAVGRLQQALTGLFSIKKREEAPGLNQVDQILLADVILQRGLLLIDRLQWAVKIESTESLRQAVNDFRRFAFNSYGDQIKNTVELETILMALEQHVFDSRKPLKIVEGL